MFDAIDKIIDNTMYRFKKQVLYKEDTTTTISKYSNRQGGKKKVYQYNDDNNLKLKILIQNCIKRRSGSCYGKVWWR